MDRPFASSAVKMLEPRPNSHSLTNRMHSSSSSFGTLTTVMTGPKTSWLKISISGVTPLNTVGSKNCPFRLGLGFPPHCNVAPFFTASSTRACTISSWRGIIMLPQSTLPSAPHEGRGFPCRRALTFGTTASKNLSKIDSYTRTRSTPTQFCPEFWKQPLITKGTMLGNFTSWRKTMTSFPPSSRTRGVRWFAADAITRRPIGVEPVKMILSTSGEVHSATPDSARPVTVATRSGLWPLTTNACCNMRPK
mmetsp:Transcript_5215/g.15178  ORF Transcript_5215/g.15178 Transcript_5215/m.15178 type:complete len:250 (-) Transcript_5215:960-1709(-)